MDFLHEFEQNLVFVENVESFRETAAYQNFVGRWSLAVYYQIRFQEIALPVELAMEREEFLSNDTEDTSDTGGREIDIEANKHRLLATKTVITALEKCWNPSIFLEALLHRFWKLTLQIIARYCTAVTSTISSLSSENSGVSVRQSGVNATNPSNTKMLTTDGNNQPMLTKTEDLATMQAKKGHSRSASDQTTSADAEAAGEEKRLRDIEAQKQRLVSVYLDLSVFCQYLRSTFFEEIVTPMIHELTEPLKLSLRTALLEGCDKLLLLQPSLTELIVKTVVSKSTPHLKSVSDIPRLYRRTNREIPSKPCPYVVSTILPVQEFFTKNSICDKGMLHEWSIQILSAVADDFLIIVSEVLAAVQKMEESLRRLKRVRDSKAGGAAGADKSNQDNSLKISDDDKIRLQLYVDVKHFILQMEKGLGVTRNEVKSVLDLEALVKEATKSCFDDYIVKIGDSDI